MLDDRGAVELARVFFIEMGKPQSFQYTEEEEEARGGDARRPKELAR